MKRLSKKNATSKHISKAKTKRELVGTLKKKAWKLMSQYVRLRDCLKTTGGTRIGRCYTCDKKYPFAELQAGHLIDGRCGEMFLDERGIRAQCSGCNVWKHGNKEIYIPKFIDENGRELYEELCREKRTPKRWTVQELLELIETLKGKIEYIKSL
jgi:hypothetical protein